MRRFSNFILFHYIETLALRSATKMVQGACYFYYFYALRGEISRLGLGDVARVTTALSNITCGYANDFSRCDLIQKNISLISETFHKHREYLDRHYIGHLMTIRSFYFRDIDFERVSTILWMDAKKRNVRKREAISSYRTIKKAYKALKHMNSEVIKDVKVRNFAYASARISDIIPIAGFTTTIFFALSVMYSVLILNVCGVNNPTSYFGLNDLFSSGFVAVFKASAIPVFFGIFLAIRIENNERDIISEMHEARSFAIQRKFLLIISILGFFASLIIGNFDMFFDAAYLMIILLSIKISIGISRRFSNTREWFLFIYTFLSLVTINASVAYKDVKSIIDGKYKPEEINLSEEAKNINIYGKPIVGGEKYIAFFDVESHKVKIINNDSIIFLTQRIQTKRTSAEDIFDNLHNAVNIKIEKLKFFNKKTASDSAE